MASDTALTLARRSLALALAALLATACGAGDEPSADSSAARNPQQVAAAADSAASPAREATSDSLPAGEWRVAVANGVVSIDASQAPRRALLEALAQRAGFALEAAPGEMGPITLRLNAQPLEAALPRVVGERSYSAEWENRAGLHRLVRLVVAGPSSGDASGDRALRPGEVSEALERALAESKEEDAMSAAEALRRVKDQDPETRLRAVLALDGEDETLAALIDVIEHDPDPRVRAAATVGLEESEEFAAVQALVGALDDTNAEVVVEAIDSLEFAGDASVVPRLRPLLSHPDARVRKAAADAVALLEE